MLEMSVIWMKTVLMKHPSILDVAVIDILHEDFEGQVLAFGERRGDCTISEEELVGFCAS